MKKVMPTEKIYYQDMLSAVCTASVIAIGDNFIVTDRTVAFPEGGGQEGDHGLMSFDDFSIHFCDTKKRYGTPVFLDDFPTINVGAQICHFVDEKDTEKLGDISIRDTVKISIDVERRERLTVSHTASHLLYLGVGVVRPEALRNVIGCHIKEDGARFDFFVDERFSQEEIKTIINHANQMIDKNLSIDLYPHERNPDAWYWKCDGKVIPCGGTHLESTGNIREISVKRKNIGKGKDRIMCAFPNAILDFVKYKA